MNINLEWAPSSGEPGDILLYSHQAGAMSHTATASAVRDLAGIVEKEEKKKKEWQG